LSQESDTDPSLAEQTAQVEDERISPQKLDAVGVTTTNGGQITQVHDETKPTERFEFELYYGLSSRTFGSVLCDILSNMATYKHIYNWNKKLFAGPLKAILKVVHRSWGGHYTLTSLQAYSIVKKILSVSDAHYALPSI
jgi:hypothetical protein